MGKHSIAQGESPCKDEMRGKGNDLSAPFGGTSPKGEAGREPPHPALRATFTARPPQAAGPLARTVPQGKARRGFTASELAEMAAFDAALEEEPFFLTKEERALSAALDREVERERREPPHPVLRATFPQGKAETAETAEHREARLEKKRQYGLAHREERIAYMRAYNEAHRQERREYQRLYEAAHKAEINARRRARYAAKKRKEKEHG